MAKKGWLKGAKKSKGILKSGKKIGGNGFGLPKMKK
jgi:hypothetical protein